MMKGLLLSVLILLFDLSQADLGIRGDRFGVAKPNRRVSDENDRHLEETLQPDDLSELFTQRKGNSKDDLEVDVASEVFVKVMEITNLAYAQPFGPIFVMSHNEDVEPIYTLGQPASAALRELAEFGNPSMLINHYTGMEGVFHVNYYTEGFPYALGETLNISIPFTKEYEYFSLATMMVNTNDGFVAMNGEKVKKDGEVYFFPAYDAGTEANNELCSSIVGPACAQSSGNAASLNGEGFVHVHPGIFGIGSLAASVYDWRNPVLRVKSKEEIELTPGPTKRPTNFPTPMPTSPPTAPTPTPPTAPTPTHPPTSAPTPTSPPTTSPTRPPVAPPTPLPTIIFNETESGSSNNPCFSSTAYVHEEKNGKMLLKDLRGGEKVLTSSGEYQTVYTVDHRDPNKLATFLQIHFEDETKAAQPLEVTSSHMIFLNDGGSKDSSIPIPASQIKIGDSIKTISGVDNRIVNKIISIQREGLYNAITTDGTIVVNDEIVASTYSVHFGDLQSEYITIFDGTVKLISHQTFLHFVLTPLRNVCTIWSQTSCVRNSNEEQEHSAYNRLGLSILDSYLQQDSFGQNMILFGVILLAIFLTFITSPLCIAATITSSLYYNSINKKKANSHKIM